MFRMKAIGIDLGTSKCCVGIFRDGKVEILENERGNKTTPSYVAFTDTKRLVGEDAKNHATLNPANTVFGVKRIIGREWEDGLLRDAVDKMPFTIMNNSEAETCIRASYKGTEELLLPQQITAMLLGKMKDLAELHLKSKVEEAVISVPASFSNAQRQATKDAAAIAGLKVLALINEPTAAAIAYQANRRKTDEENVAVVDFGAGNLSVAIVTVRRGQVIVRAVSGSTGVGGDEIDKILMDYVSGKFINKYGKERLDSSVLKERLRSCCEKLKRKLTLLPEVQETLDCFSGDIVLPVTITRDEFNSIIPSGTKSALMNSIDRAREASRIPKEKISRVVLVGGSSRIPLFRTWLANLFESKLLDKSVNPDEAVAYGATLYAALICGDNELREFELKDTVPNDFFYISEEELAMKRVFDHKSSITLPKQRVYICQSQSPFNKRSLKQKIKFYEGRHGEENPQLICTLCLDKELGQSIKYIKQITFDIDCCGIFNAVVQLEPHQVFPEVLNSYAGKLNENKLQYFTARERQLRKDDQDERERVEAMSNLEVLSLSLHSAMDNSKAKELFPEVVKQIGDKARENIQWLDGNYSATKEKCEKRLNQLEKLKSDLEYKIKQYEKTEKHRLTAVKNFKLYCSSLETTVITGMGDEPELFSELSELWEGATKWLNSSEIKSKENCDDRKHYMMKVQVKIEEKLEIKRAVDDLKKYCSKLHDMKFEGRENDCARNTVRLITEENIRCMNYIRENEFISRAECDLWKQKLEKMVVEVTSFLMEERLAAIASLESCCTHLEKLTRGIKDKDTESRQIASDATNLLNKTRQWLSETKNVTTAECDNRQKVIQSLLDEINDRKRNGGWLGLAQKYWV